MNPLEAFKRWYGLQDADVRSQIAFFAAVCLPDREARPPAVAEMISPQKFLDSWLNQSVTSKFQLLGRVLCLREVISLMVFRDRSSREDWELHMDRLNGLAAKMRSSGRIDLANVLEKNISGMAAQSAIWIAASQTWFQLQNSALSNEKIEAWYDKAI